MSVKEVHLVTFQSPGTLFSEQSSFPVDSWNPYQAALKSKEIVERYGAKPFGFYFSTQLTHDPIPDGRGGVLDVKSKEIARSAMYYLGGQVKLFDDIPDDDSVDNMMLRRNMRVNEWGVVIENTNSYKVTRPFENDDCIVDENGNITQRGSAPNLTSYRTSFKERCKKILEEEIEAFKRHE